MKTKILCVVIYSISLIACGGGGSGSDSVVPVATPPPVQTATDDACIPVGALLECSLMHQDLERTFKIYEPSSIEESTSLPVVFNFHGYGSNADEQLFYGDFRQLSEQEGFLLIVPQGSLLEGNTHWNSDSSFTSKSTADDTGFVSQIIDEISQRYEVDASKIYAVGMSNGGAMSIYLACSLGKRIAAVASVTGFMSSDLRANCEVDAPMSVLLIHGTADGVVSWDNGLGGGSILSIAEFWAAHNECATFRSETFDDYNGDGVSGVLHQHSDCSNGTLVQVYEITNMGHVWPERRRGDDINGAEVVWGFISGFSN
jgi:polyhydroxybutyrate depolymerase